MRTSGEEINNSLKKQIEITFIKVISELREDKKIELFLKDLTTKSEFESLSKRFAVCYWLKKGRSYENIKKNLKVSSATIATVAEIMKKNGVQMALKNLEAEEWAQEWSEKIKKFVRK